MAEDTQPIDILLVEDNAGDVELTEDSFAAARLKNRISVVHDGVEAIEYLKRRGKYANATRPDVVLLDLNMPRMDGREVLEIVKSDPELQGIPVIMLSSADGADVMKNYRLQANCYIKKPAELKQYRDVVETVENFWLSVAAPKKPGHAA